MLWAILTATSLRQWMRTDVQGGAKDPVEGLSETAIDKKEAMGEKGLHWGLNLEVGGGRREQEERETRGRR